jgi:hypothetical protein
MANRGPVAGVPVNACPFREFEPKCLMARTKPVAMLPAALAGATVAITPTVSAVATAARPARNRTCLSHPPSL